MIKLSSTASDMNCFIICSYGREIVLILFSVWNLFAVGPYGHSVSLFSCRTDAILSICCFRTNGLQLMIAEPFFYPFRVYWEVWLL